jgi:hypothetical protein
MPERTAIDAIRGRSAAGAFITLNSACRLLVARTLWASESAQRDPTEDPSGLARAISALAADPDVAGGSVQRIVRVLGEMKGHGLRHVWSLVRLLDPRLETALESLSWWRFDEYGLPMPTPQAWVRGASGVLYRVDFLWDSLVGEADGMLKYETRESLHKEKRRQTDIELSAKSVMRWGWPEAWSRPDPLMRALRRALG